MNLNVLISKLNGVKLNVQSLCYGTGIKKNDQRFALPSTIMQLCRQNRTENVYYGNKLTNMPKTFCNESVNITIACQYEKKPNITSLSDRGACQFDYEYDRTIFKLLKMHFINQWAIVYKHFLIPVCKFILANVFKIKCFKYQLDVFETKKPV